MGCGFGLVVFYLVGPGAIALGIMPIFLGILCIVGILGLGPIAFNLGPLGILCLIGPGSIAFRHSRHIRHSGPNMPNAYNFRPLLPFSCLCCKDSKKKRRAAFFLPIGIWGEGDKRVVLRFEDRYPACFLKVLPFHLIICYALY